VLSVELRNVWAKVIHAHRLRMGSYTIVRYFASQKFRVHRDIASHHLYILHRRIASVRWSPILLPPHGISIDAMKAKISLDHVNCNGWFAYTLRCQGFLQQNGDQIKQSMPLSNQPIPLFVCSLKKFNIVIGRMPIAMRCVFYSIPCVIFWM
jgi:hypothetical protein